MTRSQPTSLSSIALRAMSMVPWATLPVVAVSLYVVWLNHPATDRVVGMALVGVATILAAAFRTVRWAVISCAAAGGAVAVALTSREFFSFWGAGTALLVTAAVNETRWRPHVASVAALAGVLVAAWGPTRDVLPALWPVAVAAVAASLIWVVDEWAGRAHDLELHAAELQRRAEDSEAATADLERRSALAQELHDSLTHHVAAIAVQAEAGKVANSQQSLTTITGLAREALKELEVVLFDLKASPGGHDGGDTDLGLIEAKLARPLRELGVRVDVEVVTTATNPGLRSEIYRMVQEALTNVLRHADATMVQVVVKDDGQTVEVAVVDDGVGLRSGRTGGNGLVGIRARAASLGGEATITDAEPHGVYVHARLPKRPS